MVMANGNSNLTTLTKFFAILDARLPRIKNISVRMDWDPEMCRVCLTSSDKNVDLRSPLNGNRALVWLDVLNLCTCLGAKQDDDLPKNLCKLCLVELECSFEFYQKARKADQLLRNHINDSYEVETFKLKEEFKEEFLQDALESKENIAEDDYPTPVNVNDAYKTILDRNIKNENQSPDNFLRHNHLINLDVTHCEELEKSCHSTELLTDNCTFDEEENYLEIFDESEFEGSSNHTSQESIAGANNQNFIINEKIINKADNTTKQIEIKDKFCSKCGKSFVRTSSLEKHVRLENCGDGKVNTSDEAVECDLCGKPLKRWSLAYHKIRFHSKGKSFLCSACPKSFFTHNDLKVHLRTHDKKRERNFPCSICPKAFFEKQARIIHEQRHTGIKPFKCAECGKGFFAQKALEVHYIVHNRETGRHKCNFCNKHFASNVDLVVHTRFHTGIFPYKCDLCDKSFAVKSHYNYHLAKHKGVVYNCPHCKKQFTNRGSLTSHLLKHREKMPHSCSVCEKGFPTPFALKRHMQAHQNKVEKHEHIKEDGIVLDV